MILPLGADREEHAFTYIPLCVLNAYLRQPYKAH